MDDLILQLFAFLTQNTAQGPHLVAFGLRWRLQPWENTEKAETLLWTRFFFGRGTTFGACTTGFLSHVCSCLSQPMVQCLASPSQQVLSVPACSISGSITLGTCSQHPGALQLCFGRKAQLCFFFFFEVRGCTCEGGFCVCSRWNVRLQGWWLPFLQWIEHFAMVHR